MPMRSRSWAGPPPGRARSASASAADRKSTRLNSSHLVISYAVFCLKKKKKNHKKVSTVLLQPLHILRPLPDHTSHHHSHYQPHLRRWVSHHSAHRCAATTVRQPTQL